MAVIEGNRPLLIAGLGGATVLGLMFLSARVEEERARLAAVKVREELAANAQNFHRNFLGALEFEQIDVPQVLRNLAELDPVVAVRLMVAAVHRDIRWTADIETAGMQDYWQSPSMTAATRKGDCEDMALLLLHLLRECGITGYRLIVGTWRGSGHAWLESVLGTFADPTSGRLSDIRPLDYVPVLALGDGGLHYFSTAA